MAWRQVSLQLHGITLVSSPDCFPWVGECYVYTVISSWFQYIIDRFHYSCMPSSIKLKNTAQCKINFHVFFSSYYVYMTLPTQCRFIGTPTWQTTTCTIYRMGVLILFVRFSSKYVTWPTLPTHSLSRHTWMCNYSYVNNYTSTLVGISLVLNQVQVIAHLLAL